MLGDLFGSLVGSSPVFDRSDIVSRAGGSYVVQWCSFKQSPTNLAALLKLAPPD